MSNRKEAILWLIVLAALLVLPLFIHSEYILRLANLTGIYIIPAIGLHFILGMTGQISIGHAAFFGIGAYTSALLAVDVGCSFWLALPAACLMSAIFGFLLGIPAIKVKTHYLALVTIGFQEIFRLVMMNWTSFTHGATGIYQIPAPMAFGFELINDARYYYLVLGVTSAAILSAARITNSAMGRSMRAIREGEIVAQTIGIDLVRMKVLAFTLGAAYAGLGGSLYAHLIRYINPESFSLMDSAFMLIMVLIGGRGSVAGAVIGAIIITLLPEALRFIKDYHMIVFGGTVIAIMVFMPQGVVGLWHKLRLTTMES